MVTKVHAGVEMAMAGHESGSTGNWRKKVVFIGDQLRRFPSLAWKNVWKMGRDDPRRVIHAFKVGFSLIIIVSLICCGLLGMFVGLVLECLILCLVF